MARFEIAGIESGALGATMGADVFFELGMMYSTGRSVPTDLVTAHKWFNIAAARGNKEAIATAARSPPKCRSRAAVAQRAARDWLKSGAHAPESAGRGGRRPGHLDPDSLEYTSWGRPETWPRG